MIKSICTSTYVCIYVEKKKLKAKFNKTSIIFANKDNFSIKTSFH